jgi:hypothetical protein
MLSNQQTEKTLPPVNFSTNETAAAVCKAQTRSTAERSRHRKAAATGRQWAAAGSP